MILWKSLFKKLAFGEREKGLEEWNEKNKTKLSNNISVLLLHRRQEKKRMEQYYLQLQEMQDRVESRPYLFERVMQVKGGRGTFYFIPPWVAQISHPPPISLPSVR